MNVIRNRPLYAIYSYAWAGLDPANGDPQGIVDGKATKDYSAITNSGSEASVIYNGRATPSIFGNIRNTLTYHNISLSFSLTYRAGYYFRKPSVSYSSEYSLG